MIPPKRANFAPYRVMGRKVPLNPWVRKDEKISSRCSQEGDQPMSSPYTRPATMTHENEPETVKTIVREKYERCSFCNSKLLFNHDLNLHQFEVIETSR